MNCNCQRHSLFCIIPPYILERLAESNDSALRKMAIDAITASADFRAMREFFQSMPAFAALPITTAGKNRLIYDMQNKGRRWLPGQLVRTEGQGPIADAAANEAYDGSGITYDFYYKFFNRNSLDNRGMPLISSVHLENNLPNAFWNGQQMAYGDGYGNVFLRFTKSLDVIAHELTHGVISHECNLIYQDESGALNEHFADVFGVLVTQWKQNHSAAAADWLVGRDLIGPAATGANAIRNFGPGKAFTNDPYLGTDRQPKHMAQKYTGSDDYGGVHINSGIPNHAFYIFARTVGGNAWDAPGKIWYETMRQLSPNSDFSDMVKATKTVAQSLHPANSPIHAALNNAWQQVGL